MQRFRKEKENYLLIESTAFFHPEHCCYKNNYYLFTVAKSRKEFNKR